MNARATEVADGLGAVRARIAHSCAESGRDADEVLLVVVTKYFPASDVRILGDLGITDVAENRHQEAEEKAQSCADLDLRWHFVGGLQSNKAAAVASWADVVQSVDRPKLVAPLGRGAERSGRRLGVLLQVSLDAPGARHRAGCAPGDVPALAAAVAAQDHLDLLGLMAVAPLGEDPGTAFDRLVGEHGRLVREHPAATWLSAGMSGDLEAAVKRGATHVRVGSAVLGSRPAVQ